MSDSSSDPIPPHDKTNPVKLIASDLDGTIVPSEKQISPRVAQAFKDAQKNGIETIFATARSPHFLDPLIDMGYSGPVISSNGAVLLKLGDSGDYNDFEILESTTLDPAYTQEMIEILREKFPDIKFAISTPHKFHVEDGFAADHEVATMEKLLEGRVREGIHPELFDEDGGIGLVFARARGEDLNAFNADVHKLLENHDVAISLTNGKVAEVGIAPEGITKATALKKYARTLGVGSDEVLAFGDMPNDIEMLSWAGHGHAMGNAHDSVKEAAPFTAPPINEDGVACVIEEYLEHNFPHKI